MQDVYHQKYELVLGSDLGKISVSGHRFSG